MEQHGRDRRIDAAGQAADDAPAPTVSQSATPSTNDAIVQSPVHPHAVTAKFCRMAVPLADHW
jgi:hypothetical protein